MKKQSNQKPPFIATIIMLCILFSIVSYIWEKFHTVIIIAAIFAVILFIGYIISILEKRRDEKPESSNIISPNTHLPQELKNETIQRQMQILFESNELMNNSNSVSTVINRIRMACDTIDKLSIYTYEELVDAGYRPKEPLLNTKEYIQKNKVRIINQAIERNIKHEIEPLKTVNGKQKKLESLYDSMKENSQLEPDNLIFLEKFYNTTKKSIVNSQPSEIISTEISDFAQPKTTEYNTSALPAQIEHTDISKFSDVTPSTLQNSELLLNVSPEIADLIWIGDGNHKNYTPENKDQNIRITPNVTFLSNTPEEPSALYLSLPVAKPTNGIPIERPPYFPSYRTLTPEQRWLYWQFLASPYSPEHNIGYVFLFYYGLERHLLSDNLDKAFSKILNLREIYSNDSFQYYTANALTLICITRKRADLALKLLESDNKSNTFSIPINYLLLLKYTFQIPLTIPEIIKNHTYFLFSNTRYIKNQPDLFQTTFLELFRQKFNEDSLDLNSNFPIDMHQFPVKHERIFANTSLDSYEAPVPIIENKELIESISLLLNEAHETVKSILKELRKQGNVPATTISRPLQKLSPIESENIPKNMTFDFSEINGWESWSSQKLLDTFFRLSNKIQHGNKVFPKIEACEKSYRILKPVINIFKEEPDAFPPVIACREYGPHIYKLLGDWENAERIIRLCIDTGAYESPDDGNAELEYLITYKKVAETAMNFIRDNPGFLQKNIYIALRQQIGEENIPILKDFMRETYVFHKQPHGGTNELYFIERK